MGTELILLAADALPGSAELVKQTLARASESHCEAVIRMASCSPKAGRGPPACSRKPTSWWPRGTFRQNATTPAR